jgi:hypothetical protein
MVAMYNFRANPDLGMRAEAAPCIPCACLACIEQLQRKWLQGNPVETQPRYLRNTQCKSFGIFYGLNDWKIITLKPKTDADEDELEEAHAYALNGIETMNSEKVETANYGGFATNDPDAHGYYVVHQWTSNPYTLKTTYHYTLEPSFLVARLYVTPTIFGKCQEQNNGTFQRHPRQEVKT